MLPQRDFVFSVGFVRVQHQTSWPPQPGFTVRGTKLRDTPRLFILFVVCAMGALSGCAADEVEVPPVVDAGATDVVSDTVEPAPDADVGGEPTDTASSEISGLDVQLPDAPADVNPLDVSGMSVCEAYCAIMAVACVDEEAADFGEMGCVSTCESWDVGESSDTASDTASCRLYHADAALGSPSVHCAYASPDGGGICIDQVPSVCEQYCVAMITHCVDALSFDFGEIGCEETCEAWPVGTPGDDADLTADCHLTQALAAETDPDEMCPKASPGSLVCVEPEPDCVEDVDCLPGQTCVEGFCEGEALECLLTEDCEGEQLCEEGVCVDPPEPECAADGDCGADEVCTDGACVEYVAPPECVNAGDCETGEMCDAGTCVVVSFDAHIQPTLALACGACHTNQNKGNTNFGAVYEDNLSASQYCPGETVGACVLVRIEDGTMPPGGGSNLGASTKSMIQIWLDGGMIE